jgi:hypothetical protein
MRSFYLPLALVLMSASPRLAAPVYADNSPTTQPATQPSVASMTTDAPAPPPAIATPTGFELQADRDDGGGVRGSSESGLNLVAHVVAPTKAGALAMSTHFQSPKLVFYLSQATTLSVRVAIREEAPKSGIGQTPLKWLSDANAPREMSAGLHMIDLATCGVQLQPGIVYRWSVSIPVSLDDQSKQNATWGRIKYDPSAPSYGLFYDDMARDYDSLLSQPTDPSALSDMKKLLADEKIYFCQNLKPSAPEPATLDNVQGN